MANKGKRFEGRRFDWMALRVSRYGGIDVVGFAPAPPGSVLEGQVLTHFLANFESEAEARASYPEAGGFVEYGAVPVCVAHLPGEEDPVPGGMYPDDW
jgi:hypothetical protein